MKTLFFRNTQEFIYEAAKSFKGIPIVTDSDKLREQIKEALPNSYVYNIHSCIHDNPIVYVQRAYNQDQVYDITYTARKMDDANVLCIIMDTEELYYDNAYDKTRQSCYCATAGQLSDFLLSLPFETCVLIPDQKLLDDFQKFQGMTAVRVSMAVPWENEVALQVVDYLENIPFNKVRTCYILRSVFEE